MSSAETIVITGGAGFLGSHLSDRLLADGCSVVCLDNFCTGTPANVAHLIENPAFRLIRYDVTEYLHVGGPVDEVLRDPMSDRGDGPHAAWADRHSPGQE